MSPKWPSRSDWLAAYVDPQDARFKAHWLADRLNHRMRVQRLVNPFDGFAEAIPMTVWVVNFAEEETA